MFWGNYYPMGLGFHIDQAKADFWTDEILLALISTCIWALRIRLHKNIDRVKNIDRGSRYQP